jgi:hypothetical protein
LPFRLTQGDFGALGICRIPALNHDPPFRDRGY